MYLAGVSVRRVEGITDALWGTRVSPGTISNLHKKVYKKMRHGGTSLLRGVFPYVYLDGIVLKRSWGVRLFITDACMGLVESLADFYPEARWQRCMVHFSRTERCGEEGTGINWRDANLL